MKVPEQEPVKCKCGVQANYGLVPTEFGIGHWCGHMVDYDEVGNRIVAYLKFCIR